MAAARRTRGPGSASRLRAARPDWCRRRPGHSRRDPRGSGGGAVRVSAATRSHTAGSISRAGRSSRRRTCRGCGQAPGVVAAAGADVLAVVPRVHGHAERTRTHLFRLALLGCAMHLARRRASHSGHRVRRGLLMRWERARPGLGVPSVGSRHVGEALSCGACAISASLSKWHAGVRSSLAPAVVATSCRAVRRAWRRCRHRPGALRPLRDLAHTPAQPPIALLKMCP